MKKTTINVLVCLLVGTLTYALPRGADAATCASLVGKWSWFVGGDVTVNADGTFVQQSGNSGTWECVDEDRGVFALRWTFGGFVNTMQLSFDENALSSTDPSQPLVAAMRVGGAVPPGPPSAPSRSPSNPRAPEPSPLDVRVTALLFFETPYDVTRPEKREYQVRFRADETRFIGWELSVEHAATARRMNVPIEAVWRRADGAVVARDTTQTYFDAGSIGSMHADSWGWRDDGHWTPGAYRLDLNVGGYQTASASFTIYDVSPEAASAFREGVRLAREKKFAEAVARFDEALRLDRDYAEAYNERCVAKLGLKLYDEAAADCARAIEIEPRYANAYVNRGAVFTDSGHTDEAMVDANRALELNPRSAKAHANRANLHLKAERFDEAEVDCNIALAIDPELAAAYLNRAVAHFRRRRFDEAIADSTRALELDGTMGAAYMARGFSYYMKGEDASALTDLTAAESIGEVFNESQAAILEELRKPARATDASDPSVPPVPQSRSSVDAFLRGSLRFALYHELGHFVIDEYAVPVGGREEDAADRFAVFVLGRNAPPDEMAAAVEIWRYYGTLETQQLRSMPWWDEHSMSGPRAFDLACLLAGMRPESLGNLPTELGAPESRVSQCGTEAGRNTRDWRTLLEPTVGVIINLQRAAVTYSLAPRELEDDRSWLEGSNLLESLATEIGRFALPAHRIAQRDEAADPRRASPPVIPVVAESCGEANAHYYPGPKPGGVFSPPKPGRGPLISLCYELVKEFRQIANERSAK